jgi:hypothetical protein
VLAVARIAAAAAAALLAVTVLAGPAWASGVPPRQYAYRWAEAQAGAPYVWGGTGPGFDCSGLVYEAYRHAGFTLPRSTYGMLASPMLKRTDLAHANPGSLAFYGSGHVEFVTQHRHTTYGMLGSGSRAGWHRWSPGSSWRPTAFYYVAHAWVKG